MEGGEGSGLRLGRVHPDPRRGGTLSQGAYQINLLDGKEGNLTTIPAASSTGLVKRGEWNAFDVEVIGDTAS